MNHCVSLINGGLSFKINAVSDKLLFSQCCFE
uniref:Uncharacterized protein n=1 Tax=Anguilla anguilla TaxID=7936 RepID=A0A0E9SJW4_ANGAN